MEPGKTLRVETLAACTVRWSDDGWRTWHDSSSQDTGLGVYFVDLPVAELPLGAVVDFTFFWSQADRWEGENFTVRVASET